MNYQVLNPAARTAKLGFISLPNWNFRVLFRLITDLLERFGSLCIISDALKSRAHLAVFVIAA
jgi:hypothetical protein